MAEQQKAFYASLTSSLGSLRTDNTAFLVLGLLSFLYGVFHAAGPGHGKVVIGSYVLANEEQARQGIMLSFAAAMMQSLVAVGLVSIAAIAFRMTSAAMGEATHWIGVASYALIALLGSWLLTRKLLAWSHARRHRKDLARIAHEHLHEADDEHGHEHDDHDHHGHHHHVVSPADLHGDWREQLGVVLSVGARPCSGALVVLVFALSQGVYPAGIAAVFLMGLGTALTTGVLATMAISAKGIAQRLADANGTSAGALIWWAELAGAFAVLAFGLVFLLSSI
jgi:ABC-type nickel/cobalt efflux system permease component RcnA